MDPLAMRLASDVIRTARRVQFSWLYYVNTSAVVTLKLGGFDYNLYQFAEVPE